MHSRSNALQKLKIPSRQNQKDSIRIQLLRLRKNLSMTGRNCIGRLCGQSRGRGERLYLRCRVAISSLYLWLCCERATILALLHSQNIQPRPGHRYWKWADLRWEFAECSDIFAVMCGGSLLPPSTHSSSQITSEVLVDKVARDPGQDRDGTVLIYNAKPAFEGGSGIPLHYWMILQARSDRKMIYHHHGLPDLDHPLMNSISNCSKRSCQNRAWI